jgi:carbamoyl-phosphate synthase large subunit
VTNILISSAGRRNYLVRWFREALVSNAVEGRIIVVDADPHAPSQVDADLFISLPPITCDEYLPALLKLCSTYQVTFALSVNDFELSAWSRLDRSEFLDIGTQLICLREDAQSLAEDKYAMASSLGKQDILVPPTYLGGDVLSSGNLRERLGESVIIKSRYGSGSSGLVSSTQATLDRDLSAAASSVRDPLGALIPDREVALQSLAVQPMIHGVEYGMDVVSSFAEEFAAVLVRRKIRMRGGETDQATSEPAERFNALGAKVATAIAHVGLIDTDVIEDPDGRLWLIDINPRFGGGYPFSHLAGADAPSAYVGWSRGLDPALSCLEYKSGVVAAKYQGIAIVDAGDLSRRTSDRPTMPGAPRPVGTSR